MTLRDVDHETSCGEVQIFEDEDGVAITISHFYTNWVVDIHLSRVALKPVVTVTDLDQPESSD